MKKIPLVLALLLLTRGILFAFPVEFPLEVGKFAIWRGIRANTMETLGSPVEETQKQEFFLRLAIVGIEIVKERKKRKTKQVYYWLEYNLSSDPSAWAEGQKVKIRLHEDHLKKGVFPEGQVEYIFQTGKATPIRQIANFEKEFALFWPLLVLSPQYSLKKSVIGMERFRWGLEEGEGKIYLYTGEKRTEDEERLFFRKERVTGKVLIFPGLPYGVVWLNAVYEEELSFGRVAPKKMVTTVSLQLEKLGEQAKSEVIE